MTERPIKQSPFLPAGASLRRELGEWFGRAVLLVRGADEARLRAEKALANGAPLAAWRHARELLVRVPRSPIGLLLAADAAEAAWLDLHAVDVLRDLADVVPWRPDVWLRLGLARMRLGDTTGARAALVRAASVPHDDNDVLVRAVVALADLDLPRSTDDKANQLSADQTQRHDPGRALAWLDRVTADTPEVTERRALALLEKGDWIEFQKVATGIAIGSPLEGRRWLLRGQLAAQTHGNDDATFSLLRAYVLDVPGAAPALATHVARTGSADVAKVERVVRAKGEPISALFKAAFAQARGDRKAAREALEVASDNGSCEAARVLASLALADHDGQALRRSHRCLLDASQEIPQVERALAAASERYERGHLPEALDALDAAGQHPWAASLRRSIYRRWVEPQDGTFFDPANVLAELRRAARWLDDVPALVASEGLLTEAERPMRVVILGEFNAGKSTFLNALLGADVAPTGVIPTTAALHHMLYSVDPYARIVITGAPDRVVPHNRLRQSLDEIRNEGRDVVRVFVGAPIERLRRTEVLDTPGFNAPEMGHADIARRAFREAHLVIWIVDASQPLKDTERKLLAEIRARSIPIQVFVNKADRLPVASVDVVLEHVRKSLNAAELASLGPVVALSARLALAGKLGDADALDRSAWHLVEQTLEEHIVARAAYLKHLALRRHAFSIVILLAETARRLADEELSAMRAETAKWRAWTEAARWLEREQRQVARAVRDATEPLMQALGEDLAPLASRQTADARAYMARRVEMRLTEAISEKLAGAIPIAPSYRSDAIAALVPAVAAVLHGMIAGLSTPSDVLAWLPSRLPDVIGPPAAFALRSMTQRSRRPPPLAAPLAERLEALASVLAT